MKQIMLIGHGSFAEGLLSAVAMMAGSRDGLTAVCMSETMDIAEFAVLARQAVEHFDQNDEIILFSDIIGGSPLTTTLQIIDEYGFLARTMTLTGMNMPMVLTAALQRDILSAEELKPIIIQEGHAGITDYQVICQTLQDEPI